MAEVHSNYVRRGEAGDERDSTERSRRTAIVLSGGGSLGAVQVGMLRALYERGLEADLIVGTSVGAVNGGFIASRPPTPETANQLAEIWQGLGRGDIFPLNPVAYSASSAPAAIWSQSTASANWSRPMSSSPPCRTR